MSIFLFIFLTDIGSIIPVENQSEFTPRGIQDHFMALKTPVKQGGNTSSKAGQTKANPGTQMKQGKVQAQTTASGKSIFDAIPISLVLYLAKPYLAGETKEEALAIAHALYQENKYSSTLDILGEDACQDSDCDASVQHYKELIKLIADKPLALPESEARRQPTVSFKPSMFATKAPSVGMVRSAELDKAYNRIETLVVFAEGLGVRVTLEAEDHRWTDFHLETYFSLIESGYKNVGTVIQTRLFRTQKDLQRFDERMRTRVVIGIYNEPGTIAHTEKPIMKDLLVKYSRELLARGTYVEVATHDTQCLANFFAATVTDRVEPHRFETQYLQGVPRKRFQQALVSGQLFAGEEYKKVQEAQQFLANLAEQGVLVRMYLPFGEGKVAGAYCRRRLKENPNMITYGIKNLLKLDS